MVVVVAALVLLSTLPVQLQQEIEHLLAVMHVPTARGILLLPLLLRLLLFGCLRVLCALAPMQIRGRFGLENQHVEDVVAAAVPLPQLIERMQLRVEVVDCLHPLLALLVCRSRQQGRLAPAAGAAADTAVAGNCDDAEGTVAAAVPHRSDFACLCDDGQHRGVGRRPVADGPVRTQRKHGRRGSCR